MKIECSSEKLKNALIKADRITGKNLSLPILNSILLIAQGKTLKIRATNLSLGIEIEIPAKINKEGIVALKGEILSSLFSNLPKDEIVSLELRNENLAVKTRNSSILIKSYPHDDFPTIPMVSENCFMFGAEKLVDGLKSVYYSAATSDIKPEFSSVYIYSSDNSIFFVATDSFRLAERKIKSKGQNIFPTQTLIPLKNVTEIIRLFSDTNLDLKICANKNQISFSTEGIYLTSKLIDGIYPDYKQIIPKECGTEVITLKQDLLSALKVVNIFSDKFNQINLIVEPKEKRLELFSKNTDVGENKTAVAGALSGEGVELSLNYRYFLDCFQSISSDSINLRLNGPNRPMVVRGVSDESFMYLIMPMNR